MSRKGNCLDNSLEELRQSIVYYIEYYNKERIVSKLKNSPINYRERFYSVV